jgi:hypothetical protein
VKFERNEKYLRFGSYIENGKCVFKIRCKYPTARPVNVLLTWKIGSQSVNEGFEIINKLSKMPKILANKIKGYLLLHEKEDILEKLI